MATRKRRISKLAKLVKSSDDKATKTYVASEEKCIYWFNILNKELFGDALPHFDTIDIRWRRGTKAYYRVIYQMKGDTWIPIRELHIKPKYVSEKEFVETLAHEMIHHFQEVSGDPVNHGPSFYVWRELFNKKGLELIQ